jgi:uncharacterized protein (TIRG00374 family)
MRKWIITLVQITITLACFWLVIEGIDFNSAWTLMSGLSPWLVALLLALIFTQIGLIAWRLQLVVSAIGQTTTFAACLHTVMSGAFVGQTPLSTLGADAARIWYLLRGGLSLRESAGAVFIDRVAGLVALVLMVVLADIPLFMLVHDFWMRVAIVVVTLGAVCGLMALLLLQHVPQRLRRVHVVRWMGELSGQLGTVLRQRHFGPFILLLGVLGHLASVFVIYALFAAFGSPQILGDCLILTPFPLLLSLLPISVGGWGVREGTLVAAFSLVGVAPEVTLTVSITFGLILLVASLPGSIALLNVMTARSEA